MRLQSIQTDGFRNLQKTQLSFDNSINLFALIGPNGHGKTNFLEAIYLLGLTKSFRTRENQDLIGFGQPHCRLDAQVTKDEESFKLAFVVTEKPAQKTLKINGVKKNAGDYVGTFDVVFFSPDDMNMIHGAPSLRRRYLDVMLSQLSHDYLTHLFKYQNVLKQRNALLKEIREGRAKSQELSFWDESLAKHGHFIQTFRKDYLKKVEAKVQTLYQKIAGTDESIAIQYQFATGPIDSEDRYLQQLAAHQDAEILSGATSLGPHRDDLVFLLNKRNISSFGSRGEWRSLILALKFAEIELIQEGLGTAPVLLLDDVFSELDEKRQQYLFGAIKGIQTFVTTTHEEFLEGFTGEKQVYKVEEGAIT